MLSRGMADYEGDNVPFFAATPAVFDELFSEIGAARGRLTDV